MDQVCKIISHVVSNRLGSRTPDEFLSDSSPLNKAAARKFMSNGGGDDYWFPCSVYFSQLAMKESVMTFLNGSFDSESIGIPCE